MSYAEVEMKVVQWGEPGDFTGSPATVREYNPNKSAR